MRFKSATPAIIYFLVFQLLFTGLANTRAGFTSKDLAFIRQQITANTLLVSNETLYLKYYFPHNLSILYNPNLISDEKSSDFYQSFLASGNFLYRGRNFNIYGEQSLVDLSQICKLAKFKNLAFIAFVPPFTDELAMLQHKIAISDNKMSTLRVPTSSICSKFTF